jgi:hypothetical protein
VKYILIWNQKLILFTKFRENQRKSAPNILRHWNALASHQFFHAEQSTKFSISNKIVPKMIRHGFNEMTIA